MANYLLISTPSEDRATRYAEIKFLVLRGQRYEIAAHVSAPANTTAGVIFNVPEDDSPEQVLDSIFSYNPGLPILDAKRLNTSNMVQILFDGHRVPFWVRYRAATYRCKPFRRKTEACAVCWQVGHRQDVCPNIRTPPRCSSCGATNPAENHPCTPRCIVCEGPHVTGSADCPRRFQPRKRPPSYAQVASEERKLPKAPDDGPADFPGLHHTTSPDHSERQARGSKDRGKPSRDAGEPAKTRAEPKPRKQQPQGNEHKVSYSSALSRCSSQPPSPPFVPSPDILKELSAIRAEITLLLQENATLRQENKSLRLQIATLAGEPSSANPPPPKRKATSEDPHAPPSSVEEQAEQQLANIEMNCQKALLEQKSEYTNLHQMLQANLTALQANIEAVRSEMRSSIQEIVRNITNPIAFAPAMNPHYESPIE